MSNPMFEPVSHIVSAAGVTASQPQNVYMFEINFELETTAESVDSVDFEDQRSYDGYVDCLKDTRELKMGTSRLFRDFTSGLDLSLRHMNYIIDRNHTYKQVSVVAMRHLVNDCDTYCYRVWVSVDPVFHKTGEIDARELITSCIVNSLMVSSLTNHLPEFNKLPNEHIEYTDLVKLYTDYIISHPNSNAVLTDYNIRSMFFTNIKHGLSA